MITTVTVALLSAPRDSKPRIFKYLPALSNCMVTDYSDERGDWTDLPYKYEYQINFQRSIRGLEYLRERTVESEKRKGIPRIAERDDYAVYGWSDIESDSPTMAGG